MSGTQMERRRSLFPDLVDWFGTDFPRFPMWRPMPHIHPIPIEVTSQEGQYTLRAELPGMDPAKDIDITVEGDMLTVSAEHAESKEEKDHSEFRYGSFHRTVRLPAQIPPDGVEAEYEDGILTVRVAMEPEVADTARSIPVKRAKANGDDGES
ncbi:Hsp20/alpha crystallin family protein [Streptomyces sp. NBC_01618]|uniref:Hsp20/alpha crystallin family protein n=1 Tax=Streptomyces sp. NBC_01618 TaxID=2975900 RepID=UPI0038680D4A|nr:Hsp20/alpha crystallin family protein [Streptomyces sp. NBC_01618]